MASKPTWNAQRGTWYVQYWDGKTRRKTVAAGPRSWKPGDPAPTKPPPEASIKHAELIKIEKAARERAKRGLRPTSLVAFLEDHFEQYRNPETRKTVRIVIDQFLAWCKARKLTRFDQVDHDTCAAWAADAAKTLSANTIRTNRAYIAAAWGRLKKKGKIDANPWTGVEIPDDDREKPRNAWTRGEFDALLAESADWLRDILVFGVYTGLRIRAMMKVEWRDWLQGGPSDHHFGQIQVRKELDKLRIGYKVPCSEQLHDMLSRRLATATGDSPFILAGSTGKPLASRTQTHLAICRAARRAGLAKPLSPNHHMRRTFGRWAVMGDLTGEPIPVYIVSQWLGHKSIGTTMIYLGMKDHESIRFMIPRTRPPGFIPPGSTTPPAATPDSP